MMVRSVGLLILSMMILCGSRVVAQEMPSADPVGGVLDTSLASLQESVVKLIEINKGLRLANDELRNRIKVKEESLKPSQQEEDRTIDQIKKLADKKQKKLTGAPALQARLSQVQVDVTRIKNEIMVVESQGSSRLKVQEALGDQVEGLRRELEAARSVPVNGPDTAAQQVALRSERDRLQKEIVEASAQFERAQKEWQALSGTAVNLDQLAALRRDRDSARANLEARKIEVDRLNQDFLVKSRADEQALKGKITADDVERISKEVMDQDYALASLRSQIAALDPKAAQDPKQVALKDSVYRKEEIRFQEFKVHNQKLKADLDRVRREMVDLDKKKARLEKDLYGSNR